MGSELSVLGVDPVSSVSFNIGQSLDFSELHFSQPQRGNQDLNEMN